MRAFTEAIKGTVTAAPLVITVLRRLVVKRTPASVSIVQMHGGAATGGAGAPRLFLSGTRPDPLARNAASLTVP